MESSASKQSMQSSGVMGVGLTAVGTQHSGHTELLMQEQNKVNTQEELGQHKSPVNRSLVLGQL